VEINPKTRSFAFYQKESLFNDTCRQTYSNFQKCLYVSRGISSPLVSSVNFFTKKTPENTEEDRDDTEPSDEGYVQVV
jgi:hypothetical protein